jgi:ABC-type spermidine/putrescine transport system permease subunit II
MDRSEWEGWKFHYASKPMGLQGVEMLLATLVALYINAHKRQGSRTMSALDVAPWLKPELTDAESIMASMEAMKGLSQSQKESKWQRSATST